MTRLGRSELDVSPLCLGANVFGWTAEESDAFAVLDAYTDAGGNLVDTADVYGHGGASEETIGRWLASRGRDRLLVATKVGKHRERLGLSAENIRAAAEESLRRLQTDHIDLYYAHADDESVPLEETLGAFDELVRAGKVRYVAASNYSAPRLRAALAVSRREGFASFVAVQPHYNLLELGYEQRDAAVVAAEGLSCLPYYALASGFLTGKYRPDAPVESARAGRAGGYVTERGLRTLAALEEVAATHATTVAAVALAWLAAQPTVAAPIASARTAQQLADLLPMTTLALSDDEIAALRRAAAVG